MISIIVRMYFDNYSSSVQIALRWCASRNDWWTNCLFGSVCTMYNSNNMFHATLAIVTLIYRWVNETLVCTLSQRYPQYVCSSIESSSLYIYARMNAIFRLSFDKNNTLLVPCFVVLISNNFVFHTNTTIEWDACQQNAGWLSSRSKGRHKIVSRHVTAIGNHATTENISFIWKCSI